MAWTGHAIRGGVADADRLTRQAAVMSSATMSFLRRAGLRPDFACLDVGCGSGQFAMELAREVGSAARVAAINIDIEALELAGRAAAEGDTEVSFVRGDATEPFDHGTFDVAFSRPVLSHLVDPLAVL